MARGRAPSALARLPVDDPRRQLAILHAAGSTLPREKVERKAALIASYKPAKGHIEEQLVVVRFIAPYLMASNLGPRATTNMLRVVPKIGEQLVRQGVPLTLERLISVEALNRCFQEEGRHLSETTRGRMRSAAAQLGRAVHLRDYPPRPPHFSRPQRAAPYTDDDLAEYIEAASQCDDPFRTEGLTMIYLARAGLTATMLKTARGTDVTFDGDTAWIVVAQADTTSLRSLAGQPAEFVAAYAAHKGADYLLRHGFSRRKATEAVAERIGRDLDRPNFIAQRAADRWVIDLLLQTDYAALLELTGLARSTHTLDDLCEWVPLPTSDQCADLLATVTPGRPPICLMTKE